MNSTDESKPLCMPSAEAGALIESLISEGMTVRIRVLGRSMEPAIRSGDAVIVKPPRGRIRLGDILLCRRADGSGACFVHRVVWRHCDGTWRTKGDALASLDPPVVAGQVIGRVESIERADEPARIENMNGIKARCGAIFRAWFSLARAAWSRATRAQ